MDTTIPPNLLVLKFPPEVYERIPRLRTVNVVATFSVSNSTIDSNWLLQLMPGGAIDPTKFADIMLRHGNIMLRVFSRGKVVCPGARDIWTSRNTALLLCRQLREVGEIVSFRNYHIRNVVVHTTTGFAVDLVRLAKEYGIAAKYDPDNFPGLVFNICEPERTKFLVFVRGGVIIAGSRTLENARVCWAWLYSAVLTRFRLSTGTLSKSSAQFRYQTRAKHNTFVQDCVTISQRSSRNQSRRGSLLPSVSVPATPARSSRRAMKRAHSPGPETRSTSPGPVSAKRKDVDAAAMRSLEFLYYHRPACAYRCNVATSVYYDDELNRVNTALCGLDLGTESARSLVEPHVLAGCVDASVLSSEDSCIETLRLFSSELTLFVQSADNEEPAVEMVHRHPASPYNDGPDPMQLYDRVHADRMATLRGDYHSDDEAEADALAAFNQPLSPTQYCKQ